MNIAIGRIGAQRVAMLGMFGPLATIVAAIWALGVPAVILGTKIGTSLLERFSDVGFRKYTRILVSAVGAAYVLRGLALLDFM